MRRLETALQRYAWGKSGSDSMVAQLKKVREDLDLSSIDTCSSTHRRMPI